MDLKLFASMSLTYGVAMGVIWSTGHRSVVLIVLLAAIQGIAFGGIMMLLLWLVDRRRFKQGRAVGLPVRAARIVRVQRTSEDVRKACVAVLQSLPKAAQVREIGVDALNTELSMNWRTWGDLVSAKLIPQADGTTHVLFVSVPKVRTTLVDYGKNADNLEEVVAKLAERFPGKVHADPITAVEN